MARLAELIAEYNETKRREDEIPMSQVRLAKLTGLSPMTVHRHATGKTTISLLQAAAYARALGVELAALVPAKVYIL
jgi:DNA-binding transcriptional regulator YdaS (Cro superfamily)